MASFFKSLFRKTPQKGNGKQAPEAGEKSFQEGGIKVQDTFSDDEYGKQLSLLWNQYSIAFDDKQRTDIFEQIALKIIECYGSFSTAVPGFKPVQLPGTGSPLSTTTAYNIMGHPQLFIINVWKQLKSKLALIPLENETFLSTEQQASILSSLQAFALLLQFPQNCNIYSKEFGSKLTSLLSSTVKGIVLSASSLIKALNGQTSDNLKSAGDFDPWDKVKFLTSVLLYILQMFIHILASTGSNQFHDFLGKQPFSTNEINTIMASTLDQNYENQWPPLYDISTRHIQIQPPCSEEVTIRMKHTLLEDFSECGWFTVYFIVGNFLQELLEFLSSNQESESSCPDQLLYTALLAQIEWLYAADIILTRGLTQVDSADTRKFSFVKLINYICNVRLDKNQHLALVTRMLLQVLRINKFIWDNASISSKLSKFFNIESKDISLMLLGLHVNTCFRPFHAPLEKFPNSRCDVAVEYPLKVGQVMVGHDLWPWKSGDMFLGQNLSKHTKGSVDFHLLSSEIAEPLKAILISHPCYIIWDSILCEILGSHMLSRNSAVHSTKSAKVNNKRLAVLCEIFHLLYRHSIFADTCDFNVHGAEEASLPISQLVFIDFIHELFKAASADDIFDMFNDMGTFRLLVGDTFLFAQKELFLEPSTVFGKVEVQPVAGNKWQRLAFTDAKDQRITRIVLWLYLHNRIMDYFHGLVIYSLYFESPEKVTESESYLAFDEIQLLLIQFVQRISSHTKVAYHVIYETMQLVSNLNDVVLNMGTSGTKGTRDRIVIHLLQLVETIVKRKASEKQEDPVNHNKFCTPAASAVAELLLDVISIYSIADENWITAFYLGDIDRSIDFSSEVQSPRRMVRMGSTVKPGADKGDRYEMKIDETKSVKMRSTLLPLFHLLNDENLSYAGLQIIQSLVCNCMEKSAKVEGMDQREKQAIRTLAAEAIEILLNFIGVAHKHFNLIFSTALSQLCLHALIYLLRDQSKLQCRLSGQEIIRRENLLYEVLRAVARCLNGFDAIRSRKDLTAQLNELIAGILRATISLLTAAIAGNEASKSTLNLLLLGNREKVVSSRQQSSSNTISTSTPGSKKTAAMASNYKSTSGLASLILCGELFPTAETITALFDLMLDGPYAGVSFLGDENAAIHGLFKSDNDRPKLKNTSIISDLFNLIPFCEENVQQFCINSLVGLITGSASLVNISACSSSRPKIIDIALDLFPSVEGDVQSLNAELIEHLGRSSISVASMKHLFRVLQYHGERRPPYAWKVIQALQGMFLQEVDPKHTFVFEGASSGLRLPPIYKWPSSIKGLSFCCWVRIETPKLSSTMKNSEGQINEAYNPYIFCLRDKQGVGLELFLKQQNHNFCLVLQYNGDNGDAVSINSGVDKAPIVQGNWYFIGISVSTSGFYGKGEARLQIGKTSIQGDFKFSKLPENITHPIIGDCTDSLRISGHRHALRGQMGAMYFFQEALTEEQFLLIYSLGSDYLYNFEPSSTALGIVGFSKLTGTEKIMSSAKQLAMLEDEQLTKKILLSYNPVVLRGKYFLDNTPERNEIRWRVPGNVELPDDLKSDQAKCSYMHAVKLNGTFRSTHQDVRLAINSLGGIMAIIPLFALVDQKKDADRHPYEPYYFPAVLSLLHTMLIDSKENTKVFQRCGGFSSIRVLLERSNPENFNLVTFPQFIALYESLKDEVLLQDSLLENILCNFKLWICSKLDLQKLLLDWLVDKFRSESNSNPLALTVPKLIDVLYQFYDYSTPKGLEFVTQVETVATSESIEYANIDDDASTISTMEIAAETGASSVVSQSPANSKKEGIKSTLSPSDLVILRSRIYTLMKISMIKRHSTFLEDISAIIRYLALASSIEAKIETLELLIDIVTSADIKPRLVSILVGLVSGNSFLYLDSVFNCSSEKCHMLTMLFIGIVVHEVQLNWDAVSKLFVQVASDLTQVMSNNGSNQDDFLLTRNGEKLLGLKMESLLAITGPTKFMEGSGLLYGLLSVISSALELYDKPGATENEHYLPFRLFIQLLMDILNGKYPAQFSASIIAKNYYPKPLPNELANSLVADKQTDFAFPHCYFGLLKASTNRNISNRDRLEIITMLILPLRSSTKVLQLLAVDGWTDSIISVASLHFNRVYSESNGKPDEDFFLQLFAQTLRICNRFIYISLQMRSFSEETIMRIFDSKSTRGKELLDKNVSLYFIRDLLLAVDVYCTGPLRSFLVLNTFVSCLLSIKSLVCNGLSGAMQLPSRELVSLLGVLCLDKLEGVLSPLRAESFDETKIDLSSIENSPFIQNNRWTSYSLHFVNGHLRRWDGVIFGINVLLENVSKHGTAFFSIPLVQSSLTAVHFQSITGDVQFSDIGLLESNATTLLVQDDSIRMAFNLNWLCTRMLINIFNSLPLVGGHSYWCLATIKALTKHFQGKFTSLGEFETLLMACCIFRLLLRKDTNIALAKSNDLMTSLIDLCASLAGALQELLGALSTRNYPLTVQSNDFEDIRFRFITNLLATSIGRSYLRSFDRFEANSTTNLSNQNKLDSTADSESNFSSNVMKILDLMKSYFSSDITSPADRLQLVEETCSFIINIAEFIEEEIVAFQVMEVGMGGIVIKESTRGGKAQKRVSILSHLLEPTDVTQDLIARLSENETVRLLECLRQIDNNNRRSEAKWNRIFFQLANERGPWGYGNDNYREVYWMLDPMVSNISMRIRMKRNPAGSKHMVATLKSIGVSSKGADQSLSIESDDARTGIYSDLKKYKKQSNMDERVESGEGNDDDDVVDESLQEGTADNVASLDTITSDNEGFSVQAEIITTATNSAGGRGVGRLDVNRLKVSFMREKDVDYDFINKTGNNEFLWACQCYPSTVILAQDITGVYRRRYQLRNVAIEIFTTNRLSIFINLLDKRIAKKVYNFLISARFKANAKYMNNLFVGSAETALSRITLPGGMSLTQAWVNRKISNFDYLMYLNFAAGRTINDLAQYPVFPWILADYKSSKLDLKDPKTFRRLDRPIGAQLDSQRALLQEKYESTLSLQDDTLLPYHSGTHYSTSAMILWYLMRLEPYTSLHVWLQEGKFDRPDRLFYSIEAAYSGCTTNTQDSKELIPEFFYNPEFLYNINHCNFGTKQNGTQLDDIVLPKWSKDAADFIRQHREALESEYVSEHLHSWIDLIFGYKQRPPFLSNGSDRSVEACNVFVHLSYPDAVDLDNLKETDPVLYERIIRQIDCYGQTPIQLFSKEHPQRKSLEEVNDLIWPIASSVLGADTIRKKSGDNKKEESSLDKPNKVLCYGDFKVSNFPILYISDCSHIEKLVTVDSCRVLGSHMFQIRQPDNVPPFALKLDKVSLSQNGTGTLNRSNSMNLTSYLHGSIREKVVGTTFAAPVVLAGSVTDRIVTQYDVEVDFIGSPTNKINYIEEELRGGKTKVGGAGDSQRRGPSTAQLDASQSRRPFSTAFDTNSPLDSSRVSVDNRDRAATISVVPQPNSSSAANNRSSSNVQKKERVDLHLNSHLFSTYATSTSRLIFSCGHWDNSFKVTAIDTGKLMQSISYHREVVSCITSGSDYGKHWVVTGSKDCTLTVWELFPERESEPVNVNPLHVLYGHDDAVTCVVIKPDLDLIVSGSDDGTIIMYTLREGQYIRSIVFGQASSPSQSISSSQGSNRGRPEIESPIAASTSSSNLASMVSSPNMSNSQANNVRQQPTSDKTIRRVHLLLVTADGAIIGFSNDGYILASYTLSGKFLKMISSRERLHVLLASEDGKVVVTGGERGLVVMRWVHNLSVANTGARRNLEAIVDGSTDRGFEPFPSAIRSMTFTSQERHLIVGLETGEIRIMAQDSEYLQRKLHRRLIEMGILPT